MARKKAAERESLSSHLDLVFIYGGLAMIGRTEDAKFVERGGRGPFVDRAKPQR